VEGLPFGAFGALWAEGMHCLDNFTAITRIRVTITTQPSILNKSGLAI